MCERVEVAIAKALGQDQAWHERRGLGGTVAEALILGEEDRGVCVCVGGGVLHAGFGEWGEGGRGCFEDE